LDFSLFSHPLAQGLMLLVAALLLVLLILWLVYSAVKAAVRDGMQEARRNASTQTWLPTERQTLERQP
jgi:uncharacterized membrane protein